MTRQEYTANFSGERCKKALKAGLITLDEAARIMAREEIEAAAEATAEGLKEILMKPSEGQRIAKIGKILQNFENKEFCLIYKAEEALENES
ncbi:MAG: hypothetical protein LUD47_03065 [Clostridia bacterium]|nr:hypothetical protein [Clostridia bacterium]